MNPYGIKVESQSLARGQADKAQKCPSFFVGGWVCVWVVGVYCVCHRRIL